MEEQTVRLTKDTIAIVNGSGLIVLPSGALVRILWGPKDAVLVRALYNGQEAEVFSQDVKDRATPPRQN